ncbi:OmpA family protein, partial [Pseudomonas sp. SIMBA_059]
SIMKPAFSGQATIFGVDADAKLVGGPIQGLFDTIDNPPYPNVTKLAQFLQENPERKVIVEGYTDSVGSANYNQTLSERRAAAV